jgi:hypothetical protein
LTLDFTGFYLFSQGLARLDHEFVGFGAAFENTNELKTYGIFFREWVIWIGQN